MRRFLLLLVACFALSFAAPATMAQVAPETAMQDALRAFDALRQGNWQLAQFYATRALDAGTLARGDQAGVMSYRADARRRQGDYGGAIDDYSQALAIGLPPQFAARVHNNRAQAHLGMARADLALQDYTRAVTLDPTFAEAFNNRGALQSLNGMHDQAIADHNTAIRLNPNNSRAFSNRAQAYLRLKFYEEAIEDFTTAMDLALAADEAVVALFNRGLAWEGLGIEDEARADFALAFEMDPGEEAYREKFLEYGLIRP
jgi:tetratricopeptide (TPR) repeat protein